MRFHQAIAIALLVTAFAGFAPTYFLRGLSERPPLSPLLHLHGFVFTAWMVLYVVQTTLVARNNIAWHRRLGIAGGVVAVSMVPLGILAAISSTREENAAFVIFPLGQILMFAGFVGAALGVRCRQAHRRLMLVATVVVVIPAIARLPYVHFPPLALAIGSLFIAAAMVHDRRSLGRVHRVYIVGFLVLLLSGPARFAVSQTSVWQAFARQLLA